MGGNINSKNIQQKLKKVFESKFGYQTSHYSVSPASLVLLGDHTHYNDGINISTTVDRYSAAAVSVREDDLIRIHSEDERFNAYLSLNEISEKKLECGSVDLNSVIELLKEKQFINTGFDCAVQTNIPDALGLGRFASLQFTLLSAINSAYGLNFNLENIIELGHKAGLKAIGKISNKTHYHTISGNKANSFFKIDFRKNTTEIFDLNSTDYCIVICETDELIENPTEICNERISECEVGAQALRLYIWGIKSLRDVELDFLEKHAHVLPKRVYKRALYNVLERMRSDKASAALDKHDFSEFGKLLFESHASLRSEYEIGNENLDFLVDYATKFNGVLGSKLISCSHIHSTLNIVEKSESEKFTRKIKHKFKQKYDRLLKTHVLNICDGIKAQSQ
ncbi:MAG: galactokinase family protein [Bacteroidota bacterium]